MRAIISLLTLQAIFLCALSANTRPEPPLGFHWQALDSIRAAILAPDGWHFRHERADGTEAFFLAQDAFSESGKFKTGLTLNCVRGVSSKSQLKPSEYIHAFTSEMDGRHSISDARINSRGPFSMIWFGVISPKDGPDATRMIYFLIGNDSTDTAYIFIFEAPVEEWDKAHEAGSVMLKNVSLDTTY